MFKFTYDVLVEGAREIFTMRVEGYDREDARMQAMPYGYVLEIKEVWPEDN